MNSPCGLCGHAPHIEERCKVIVHEVCTECDAPTKKCNCLLYMTEVQAEENRQLYAEWESNLEKEHD